MLRQVVKATQVTDETLQLLEELIRQEETCNELLLREEGRRSIGPLTSVLPFLTSSKRSNTSARLGSSESTNHIGGVDGYDSCDTGTVEHEGGEMLDECW